MSASFSWSPFSLVRSCAFSSAFIFFRAPNSAIQVSAYNPRAVIASLSLTLYLVLKLRHHQPVLRPLGWIWPRTAHIVVALLGGILLAASVALYLHLRHRSMPPIAVTELILFGLLLGPVLEESFFRGCLLPLLAQATGKTIAMILTAILFALFHQPSDLAHWMSFTVTGLAYGSIRVASRSTMAAAAMHAAYNFALFLLAVF